MCYSIQSDELEEVDTFEHVSDDDVFPDPEDDLNYDIYDADEDERD